PSIFGGSKEEALKYYLKAEQFLLKNGIDRDWNLLSLWAQIGLTYEELDNPQKAELYYRKALNAEPQFKWVRDELYTNLKKKKLR
ncbi:tetratricopeptide repeat protein, partial [Porphyromonas endodontalis]